MVQAVCILLILIDVYCLGKDTFVYPIQLAGTIGAILTCWVWIYYLAQFISFYSGDSKVAQFLLWSLSVIVFFSLLIPAINVFYTKRAVGREYSDSEHEILIWYRSFNFPFGGFPNFVFYRKGWIIDHYMDESIGYNLPGEYNKQWKFYDDLGVAVLTADSENNDMGGYLTANKFYVLDDQKAKAHKKEITQLEQQLFNENKRYIVFARGYYLKNGFDTHTMYDTQKRTLLQAFFSDSTNRQTPDDIERKFSRTDNDSIIACIRSLPLTALPVNVGKDDSLGMSINNIVVTDQNARKNPVVRKKLMWLFHKLK